LAWLLLRLAAREPGTIACVLQRDKRTTYCATVLAFRVTDPEQIELLAQALDQVLPEVLVGMANRLTRGDLVAFPGGRGAAGAEVSPKEDSQ